MYPVRLDGSRVILRELEEKDLDPILAYARDLDVMYWTVGRIIDGPEESTWLNEIRADAIKEPRRGYGLAIEHEGRLVGTVTLEIENTEHARGHLGYALRKDVWGNGFATEAAQLMIDFGFNELGLRRIYATLDVRNERSRRVLEKIGMVREGTLRSFMRKDDGWTDSYLYAMVLDDNMSDQ